MINTYVLVGRLTRDFEIEEKDGKKTATNTLAVPRPYKNANGEYDTDFFPISTYDNLATTCAEHCKKGDMIGINGNLTAKDNKNFLKIDRMTFISSKSKKDELEQEKKLDM